MPILLTGVTGFAGSWLAEALLAGGEDVVGLARETRWPDPCAHLAGRVPLIACDLTDADAVTRAVRDVRPRHVYHLAGYAFSGRSFREPDAAWQGNLAATRVLLEAVVRSGLRPRVLSVSSGLVYGEESEAVLTEASELRPASPYAASKAAADLLGYQFFRSEGLEVVRARPFNHIGPRQSPDFAVSSFARQLAEARAGRRPPLLETGDLSAWRDLTDVRDVADAYVRLMERGRPGEAYNVAAGAGHRMSEYVDRLVAVSGLNVERRARPGAARTPEERPLRISVEKIRSETGWCPTRDLDQTLRDTLDYWGEAFSVQRSAVSQTPTADR